ncbi:MULTISPECIES: hypothetical protein [unclassified Nocardioides]|jgi:hypothetical protein|uniref:hypothetical protein n=1 Tax=unclassified Nocardioides TaxID=2615069 RepID=UPI0011531FC8|nr:MULTISPECIES: hypothetical protein [unclassified Nocardioides]TQK72501.1 hypothetical protein FBY23_4317 [Nocardioides sp. SLBN-35]WGY03293.1 hypothetical protein QI633_05905 [Nocardioides sp. QY071]
MSALHTLDVRLLAALADAHLVPAERDRVLDVCDGAVEAVRGLGVAHPGRAVREVALLMLAEDAPHLDRQVRGDLARLCEVEVVRGF